MNLLSNKEDPNAVTVSGQRAAWDSGVTFEEKKDAWDAYVKSREK